MSDGLVVQDGSTAQDTNEIAAFNPVGAAMQILSLNKDFDVDKLGGILELQMKHEANEARKAYARDFASVQASIESVIKTKRNNQTNSNYAALEDVVNVCKPVYTESGFSVIFYEGESALDKHMRICADVLHRDGHKETYHYDNPLGGKGIKGNVNMTDIHGKATSVAYGRRYLLCMIWNIPTEDNDGNQNPNKPAKTTQPTEDEKKAINKVFDALLDSVDDDKMIDIDKFTAEIYARAGNKYPQLQGLKANDWAKWVIDGGWLNLVCKPKTNN